jgi:hypothetical protein
MALRQRQGGRPGLKNGSWSWSWSWRGSVCARTVGERGERQRSERGGFCVWGGFLVVPLEQAARQSSRPPAA